MPLTINLFHEEQFLLKQSKRDPLKLGLYALSGVAALFILFYAGRLISSGALDGQFKAKQAEWAKQEPKAKAAEAREKELSAQILAAETLGRRIENRFYWAPLLETLLKSVPGNVQVVNLAGSNDLKSDKVGLTVEGIVAGEVPRLAADKFRTSLNESLAKNYKAVEATFRSLEDATTPVSLNGKPTPTARFTIEVKLDKPLAVPAATPVPERRARR